MQCAAPQNTNPVPALSKKQREIVAREELILDTAQSVLHEQGYSALTMERIAEATEYSKGTIYNHFSSKEDMVCSLCCRSVKTLIELFTRASEYNGSSRERFAAIGIGYSLYHQAHPMAAHNLQIIKINAVREKISDAKLGEMESLEQHIIQIAMDVVTDAITCGDLAKDISPIANSIVFGIWSMYFGALLLEQSDIPLQDLGFSPTVQLLWLNTQKFLDGYHWLPLSSDTDNDTLFRNITADLYQAEINMLNKKEK